MDFTCAESFAVSLNIFYSEFQFVYRYNNEDNTNI